MKYPQKQLEILRLSALFVALITYGCAFSNAPANNRSVATAEQTESINTTANQAVNQVHPDINTSAVNSPNDLNSNVGIQTSGLSEVLYDFRRIDDFVTPQKFAKREEQLVLDFAFGVVKSDIAPSGTVRQRVNGAFTQAGSSQTLYLASGGEEPHKIITIYDGTRPLFKIRFEGEEILKTIDLDRDGRDELLITKGDVYMSGRDLDAQIIRLTESKIEVIETFKKICETADSLNHEKTNGEVAVITFSQANPVGAYPKFTIKKYDCAGAQGALDPKTCRAK